MAYTGQTIENPISGERITFTQTAADTDGELLAFDMTLSVDGHVPGAHVHPAQEERFEIVSGTMKFRTGGKKIVAGPGDVVTVPAGARPARRARPRLGESRGFRPLGETRKGTRPPRPAFPRHS